MAEKKTVEKKVAAPKTGAKKAAAAKEAETGTGTIRIQYYRSYIAAPKTHKNIVNSLGLTKLNQIVERTDSPGTRGFVAKVPHLLRIIE